MSKEDLIPFNAMSKERQRELSRRGGKTVTEKQRLAQKLRFLRKKGMTDAASLEIWEALTSSTLSATEQYGYIKKMEPDCKTLKEKATYANLKQNWHKMHHGERKKEEHTHTHHIINWTDIIANCEIKEGDGDRPKEVRE